MINFINDYSEGAAPEILVALQNNNDQQFSGYGTDTLCQDARELLSFELERNDLDIHFLEGGTQANLTLIASALKSHEAVISTDYGHIALHETGAVEATGHKVLTVKHQHGKLNLAAVKECLELHNNEHYVKPKMLYLSETTELGTIYKKEELAAVYDFAKVHNLFVYIDGARLGSALTAKTADVTMADIPNYCDAFSIGGTKNGMLMGEAMVIVNPLLKEDFRYHIKQRGGLMAKGWLLGLQFKELFRDGLFYRLAEHSNMQGDKIKQALDDLSISFFAPGESNQLFPILYLEDVLKLSEQFGFEIIEKVGDNQCVIRFVTSWATTNTAVMALTGMLEKICYGKY